MIQLIGWLGMGSFLLSYQFRSNRILLLLQMLGAGLFCLQFWLLEAYSGCLSLILIMLRCAMLTIGEKHTWTRWKGWPYILGAACLAVMLLTWDGPVSLLSFLAAAVANFYYWSGNAGKIRAGNLFCACPCWMIYDLLVGSYGGAANELFTIASILVSIRRFGWDALFRGENSGN